MSAYSTSEVGLEVHDDVVTFYLSEADAGVEDSQYDGLRILVRFMAEKMIKPTTAILLGAIFIENYDAEDDGYCWKHSTDYHLTKLEVWNKLFWHRENPDSWFFPSAPVGLNLGHLDQAFVNDAICLLEEYCGPSDINELLIGIDDEICEMTIARKLLGYCKSVFLVKDDGLSFTIYRNRADCGTLSRFLVRHI